MISKIKTKLIIIFIALVFVLTGTVYAQTDAPLTVIKDEYAITELRNEVVNYAKRFVGVTPYVAGQYSLYGGTDCSGFVWLIFNHFGISTFAGTAGYTGASFGRRVTFDELLPGDIVVYGYCDHVGIYTGDGNVIHCSCPEVGTTISNIWYRGDFYWGLRVIE